MLNGAWALIWTLTLNATQEQPQSYSFSCEVFCGALTTLPKSIEEIFKPADSGYPPSFPGALSNGMCRCHEATHVGRDQCKGSGRFPPGFDGSSAVHEPHEPMEGFQGCGGV
jgi:hypothetical protein